MASLLTALLDNPDEARRLPLSVRSLTDPSIALLDAWATMADVIDFYERRIAAEGYLATAVEPGSILALTGLMGVRPRMGLAASVTLAYTLLPDPADTASVLTAGLLSQSVAGAGEQPQTFETEADVVARPSWNTLTPRMTVPLAIPTDADPITELMVSGTANRLSRNDFFILDFGRTASVVLQAATVEPDPARQRTRITIQPPRVPTEVAEPHAVDRPVAPASTGTTLAGATLAGATVAGATLTDTTLTGATVAGTASAVTSTLGGLLSGLAKKPRPIPSTLPARSAEVVFSPISDTTPRLLAALRPAAAGTIYSALATSVTRGDALPALAVQRVVAAPFGAQAPPRAILGADGLPVSTKEWALGLEHTITLTLSPSTARSTRDSGATGVDHIAGLMAGPFRARAADESREEVSTVMVTIAVGDQQATNSIVLGSALPLTSSFGRLGTITVTQSGDHEANIDYTDPPAPMRPFRLIVGSPGSGDLTFSAEEFDNASQTFAATPGSNRLLWRVSDTADAGGTLGPHALSMVWSKDRETQRPTGVTLAVSTPLGPADRAVLNLDARYDTITAGSRVVIARAPVDATDTYQAGDEPILATVLAADPVSVSQYGLTAKTTRLRLDTEWIGPEAVSLADARRVTIYAQSDPLTILTNANATPVSGDVIELDGLHAGLDVGRTLVVAGRRVDLPGVVVPGAEAVVVAGVDITADQSIPGDQPRTTLTLAAAMAYAYERDTVMIYGNVVKAHQGATRHEVLGSGDPSRSHQQFTLTSGPTLADPTSSGIRTSLGVWVDGRRYDEVPRIDATTPPRSYLTGVDGTGSTTITFAAPLPAGTENIVASYRAGIGSQGNVRSHQVTQLLSRPLSVSGVDNPLAGSDGSDPDTADDLRARATAGLDALGGVVSVSDYADLARSWSGIDKAVAFRVSDGRQQVVHLTVAGPTAQPLAPQGDLVTALTAALSTADPNTAVVVTPAELSMMIMRADVVHSADRTWSSVSNGVRDALLAAMAYPTRTLGQDVVMSELVAAAHAVPGVLSFLVTGLALVTSQTTPAQVVNLPNLLSAPVPKRLSVNRGDGGGSGGAHQAAQVAYLSADVPDTLILAGRTP